jgi:DNA-binding XRE family transcriptional regulator
MGKVSRSRATPLKTERLRLDLSTTEVAAAVGVSQPTITRIENGTKSASLPLAESLSVFFGNKVTRDQILYPEDYPQSAKKPGRAQQLAKAS